MSHLTCPKCGSTDHTSGYGLACSPMGAYTICNGCDAGLEYCPDLEGVPKEQAEAILTSVAAWRKEFWGATNAQ